MPRPNKPRAVLAEDHLAHRIAMERDARGWTNDGLAQRMTTAGCAMTGSAIFKIEKGVPRRRIVVDELVAFAKVFGIPVDELLVPPEVTVDGEVTRRVIMWSVADDAANAAIRARDEAWRELSEYVADNPSGTAMAEEVLAMWAEGHFQPEHRIGATAYRMWELTHDEAWMDAVREQVNGSRDGIDPEAS